ncbi:hypothetical protein OV450_3386 [Actinobacteria bacterium OV450]|nr:hypothetical protein OV450_3386 [Actinobacteria bacterium OV450]
MNADAIFGIVTAAIVSICSFSVSRGVIRMMQIISALEADRARLSRLRLTESIYRLETPPHHDDPGE